MTATGAIGPFTYAVLDSNPAKTFGPGSLSGQGTTSFDLNILETKDFYQGLLQPLDPIAIELWIRQGLPRALAFYVLLDSIRISASDGVYEYKNDPGDDLWLDDVTGLREPSIENCRPRPTGDGNQTNYDVDRSIWHGVHGKDCHFQKFQYLVNLAVKYGLHLEAIAVPSAKAGGAGAQPKALKTAIATPNAVQATTPNATPTGAADTGAVPAAAADTTPKTKTQICYDEAVLTAIHEPVRYLPLFTICGRNKPSTAGNSISLRGVGTFKDTTFVMRSLFGVFQYLGRVFKTGSTETLTLGPRGNDVLSRNDDHLLTIVPGIGPDCFALAVYRVGFYCVPNEGADNTKLIFTMLRAMLATNISAALLNSSATVRVTP